MKCRSPSDWLGVDGVDRKSDLALKSDQRISTTRKSCLITFRRFSKTLELLRPFGSHDCDALFENPIRIRSLPLLKDACGGGSERALKGEPLRVWEGRKEGTNERMERIWRGSLATFASSPVLAARYSTPAAPLEAPVATTVDEVEGELEPEVAWNRKKEAIDLERAVEIAQEEARAKFSETVELHVKLATDPKRSDHIVRGSAVLPHGTGKQTRIAVFATDFDLEKAKSAGADVTGGKDLVDQIRESKGSSIDFDQAIATPAMMSSLASIARILGPKGLMPNPKKGTVTDDVAATINEFRKGRVDFRQDKGAVIHAGLGKVSLNRAAIVENVAAFFGAIMLARPKGVKGSGIQGFVKSVTLCTTMGKSIRVATQSILNASLKARKRQ